MGTLVWQMSKNTCPGELKEKLLGKNQDILFNLLAAAFCPYSYNTSFHALQSFWSPVLCKQESFGNTQKMHAFGKVSFISYFYSNP